MSATAAAAPPTNVGSGQTIPESSPVPSSFVLGPQNSALSPRSSAGESQSVPVTHFQKCLALPRFAISSPKFRAESPASCMCSICICICICICSSWPALQVTPVSMCVHVLAPHRMHVCVCVCSFAQIFASGIFARSIIIQTQMRCLQKSNHFDMQLASKPN